MTRPYRKDGYVHRRRVHVRMDETIVDRMDELAASLCLSRSHLCDLILSIAVEEGSTWLQQCINQRVEQALQRRRDQWGSTEVDPP